MLVNPLVAVAPLPFDDLNLAPIGGGPSACLPSLAPFLMQNALGRFAQPGPCAWLTEPGPGQRHGVRVSFSSLSSDSHSAGPSSSSRQRAPLTTAPCALSAHSTVSSSQYKVVKFSCHLCFWVKFYRCSWLTWDVCGRDKPCQKYRPPGNRPQKEVGLFHVSPGPNCHPV